MAQWVKVSSTKAKDLSSITRTHMVEKREQNPTCYPLTSTYTQIQNKYKLFWKITWYL